MFNKYPYTDFHELNLDWVIERVKYCVSRVEEFENDLDSAVEAILTNWLNDGTVEQLINEEIFDDLNTKIDEAIEDLTSLSGTVSGHTSSISSLNSDVDALETTVTGHTTSINSLNSTVAGHTSSISSLNSTVASHTASIISLNTDIDNLESELNDQAETIGYLGWYVTPQMYGAKADGSNNDTTAIQNAINSGYRVYVPEGNYFLAGKLSIPANTVIKGDNANFVFGTQTGSTAFLNASYNSNISISGINFDFGSQTVLRYGISFINATNIRIENCTFQNGYGYAIRLNDTSDVQIVDCGFSDITGASGNPGGCIYGQNMSNILVDKCTCSNIYDHFFYDAGVSLAEDIIISNCNLKTTGVGSLTGGAAIVLYANVRTANITNCIMSNCAIGIQISTYESYATAPSRCSITNVSIIGNRVDSNDGIIIMGDSDTRSTNHVITNCTIIGMTQDGISTRYTDSSLFSNMRILNCNRCGIYAIAARYNRYDNCIISGCNQGVEVDSSSVYDFITNMRITSCTSYGIYTETGSSYCLIDNVSVTSSNPNYTFGGTNHQITNSGTDNRGRSILYTTNINESVYHDIGDLVINATPSAGYPAMWICTAAGQPGTLLPIGGNL